MSCLDRLFVESGISVANSIAIAIRMSISVTVARGFPVNLDGLCRSLLLILDFALLGLHSRVVNLLVDLVNRPDEWDPAICVKVIRIRRNLDGKLKIYTHVSILVPDQLKGVVRRTDCRGKDQERPITRHEMPVPVSLDQHPQIITYHIPYSFQLITEYIVDIPNGESSRKSENTTKHRLDDFTSRRVIGW